MAITPLIHAIVMCPDHAVLFMPRSDW